jgi:hypothetical protein
MDEHLVDYISKEKKKGFSKDEIISRLKRSGYSKNSIEKHFESKLSLKHIGFLSTFRNNKPLDLILILFIVCFLFSIFTYNNNLFTFKPLFNLLTYALTAILVGSVFMHYFFGVFDKEQDTMAHAITTNIIFGIFFLIVTAIFDLGLIALLIGLIIYILFTKFIFNSTWKSTLKTSIATYISIIVCVYVVLFLMALFAALIKLAGGIF